MLIKYSDAIREATIRAMKEDEDVFVIGEGVPDPKAVFGTTKYLKDFFPDRVFDMPVSENAGTGVCIGSAITGGKPILVHQRIDFSLYAMDQLINNAAKWHSMFGGNAGNVPLVVRMIVGRGWGQGNQHSQNLASMYAQFPGLRVVCPSNARDAHGLLLTAIKDPNPVVFIEHRWCHSTESEVNLDQDPLPYLPEIKRPGKDVTIVAWGYMVIQALKVAKELSTVGVEAEVIDLKTLNPLILNTISVKTKRLVILDETWMKSSLANHISTQLAQVLEECDQQIIACDDIYSPSTPHLSKNFYPKTSEIVAHILKTFKYKNEFFKLIQKLEKTETYDKLDVPDHTFTGPF